MDDLKLKKKEMRIRMDALTSDPEFIEIICSNVANGGSLIEMAKMFNVSFGMLISWIRRDKERNKRYSESLIDRDEWSIERLLAELRLIGYVDIREAYTQDGNLKPVHELPETLARAVDGIEVFEEFISIDGKREKIGETKKLKMISKIKAIELMGKQLKMFIEKHEHEVGPSLADLVLGSMKQEGDSGDGA